MQIDFVDPYTDAAALQQKGYTVNATITGDKKYDAVILAVKHDAFADYTLDYLQTVSINNELNLFDVKAFYNREEAIKKSKCYWRL